MDIDFINVYPYLEQYVDIIIKIVLAVVLGGLIGMEREHINKPAGFRTHILVCVGAALAMITSEYMFEMYRGATNMDPARLGAQVISGIGFLGAGTIIKDGVTVKGLTTAASLWAVSCIGLAIGSGFYSGAIITSVIVYVVLLSFGRIEVPIINKDKKNVNIKLEVSKNKGIIGNIEKIFQENKVIIKGIKYVYETEEISVIKLYLTFEDAKQYDDIVAMITDIDGVKRIMQY